MKLGYWYILNIVCKIEFGIIFLNPTRNALCFKKVQQITCNKNLVVKKNCSTYATEAMHIVSLKNY